MRICLFLPDDYKGGVFPVVRSICQQARVAGHNVSLLMLCPPAGKYEGVEGSSIYSLNLPPGAPEAPARILSWLSEHGTEALVLNGCEEVEPVIPYLPDHVRCLFAIHDTARWYWTPAVQYQLELDGIIAVSEAVACMVRPHLIDSNRLTIIPNGTSFPTPPDLNDVRPNDLLFVGGDDPMKGAGDAALVWEALQRQGFKGRLHWCGPAHASFVRRLDRLPGRERIIFHGRISRDRIFELARHSKVVLALTRAESFGMVTLEAMSMGCVPVAWDIETGTKTLVQPNVQGGFVPLGNYGAFASGVLDILNNHEEFSRAAMLRARTDFTEEAMWIRYEHLFRQCAIAHRGVRPLAGTPPPRFKARRRLGRMLPSWAWKPVRNFITNNPQMAYLLRNFRRI